MEKRSDERLGEQLEESTKEQVWELLRKVHDPELGVNIVDLGLVYDLNGEDEHITVIMTLTTPGCPMHDMIAGGVRHVLLGELGFTSVDVNVVWEPAWQPAMMSEEAKEFLGYC
ncbi:metal-sulfur cluster assembly factor [Paenibacillus sp. FSL H8-0537]|uniref:metal-sulfur cluster assembly factor n=1 Tax=Paenibacillus sp. FSL H8-0537 TaxID=2921399 RepID=UPI0031013333